MGDYEATLFSTHSHNREVGEVFVKKEKFDKLAEGVGTMAALMVLSRRYYWELPICKAVHDIIKGSQDPQKVLEDLFWRSAKYEF